MDLARIQQTKQGKDMAPDMNTTAIAENEMTGKISDCCAVLLRGGKSRRMGRDKASLPWQGGMTFLQAVASQLDLFEEKYLSVSAPQPDGLSPDWVILPDRVPDCGPLGGIYTALAACRAEWAMVASCDIPAVRRSLFLQLLERRGEDCDLVVPVTPDGRRHMTCALYRKALLPVVEGQILRGDYRLRLLPALCRAVELAVTGPEMSYMLSNINSEADYRRAAEKGITRQQRKALQGSRGK